MTELETKVKCNEQKHVEKDNLIKNLNKQIVDQNKKVEDQADAIVKQNKQIVNLERQNENQDRQFGDQNKQIVNLERQSENQIRQIGDQKKQIEALQQRQTNHQASLPLSMIVPSVEDDSNYSPVSTAFQWKFNLADVKSCGVKLSPPFYNVMNSHCFKLAAYISRNNKILIGLARYRGKHDHKVNEIKGMTNIDFQINIFKNNGKLKTFKWSNKENYSILRNQMISNDWRVILDENEIESMTFDVFYNIEC